MDSHNNKKWNNTWLIWDYWTAKKKDILMYYLIYQVMDMNTKKTKMYFLEKEILE